MTFVYSLQCTQRIHPSSLKIFVHQLAVEKRNMTKATQHLLENWRDDSAWPASNFSVTD